MNINWYPGHMKKTGDEIKSHLKLVDFVIEITDARIPASSRNPLLDQMLGEKPRMILLNKMDLAEPARTKEWISYYEEKGILALEYDSTKKSQTKKIYELAKSLLSERLARQEKQERKRKEIRMMIVGVPNSGKSTFINNISKRKGTKIGNRPGVTRQKQWIRTSEDIVLLDTPGILWPKFEEKTALHLAFTGAIKDELLPIEEIGLELLKELLRTHPDLLVERYGINEEDPLTLMEEIARKTGCILRGQEVDYTRVSNLILDDFRKGRLGRITLERVVDYGK